MMRSFRIAISTALIVWAMMIAVPMSYAGAITLSCTAPTHNEGGTELTDLAGYRFYYGTEQSGPYPIMESRDAAVCAYIIENLTPGTYYIVATAINDAGVESRFSNEVTKKVLGDPVIPDAPANLVATGTLVAYGISQTKDRLVTYPVGTVPEGTPCDGSMNANGLNLVPFDAVVFVGSVRPPVVVAQCGAG